jgi:hypothetical protein
MVNDPSEKNQKASLSPILVPFHPKVVTVNMLIWHAERTRGSQLREAGQIMSSWKIEVCNCRQKKRETEEDMREFDS